jgi:Tfp pilus assembly protein PilX
MTRNGSALFVALLVVLLGALVSVLATMIAATEVRAGAAWRDQQVAASLATSALARSRERAESLFDSLPVGTSIAMDDTLSLRKLSDSFAVITAAGQFRSGLEVNSILVSAWRDSLGGLRLTPPGSRSRFHPVP